MLSDDLSHILGKEAHETDLVGIGHDWTRTMAFEPTTTAAEMYLTSPSGLGSCVPKFSEIVVDSFAGGGGASTGIEMALQSMASSGVPMESTDVTVAINHNSTALAMHCANHPSTIHMEADIWTVDPLATTQGRPVGLFWASPDCTHHSRAKGGTPVSDNIRGLAWVVAHWAEMVMPRMIFLENVEEFEDWGPTMLSKKGRVPNPNRKGQTFKKWVGRFRKLGYRVDWRVLRACDYGAPTIRKRLFVIMRRDNQPIVWPAPTHGDPKSLGVREGRLQPWRTAADIIDWALPGHSILMDREQAQEYKKITGFIVQRPLAFNTMARIAAGVKRYILSAAEPFVVTCIDRGENFRGQNLGEPSKTVASERQSYCLGMPFVTTYYGQRDDGTNDRGSSLAVPLPTVTTANRHGVVHAFLTSHQTHDPHGVPVDVPLRTITGIPKTDPVIVTSVLPPLTLELTERARRVAGFLRAHGQWDEREFVTVGQYVVIDIGMRMLTPRELARAQGFPDDYILAAPYNDGILSESDQRHKIGNSVSPPVAAALVAANYVPQIREANRADQQWLFEESA